MTPSLQNQEWFTQKTASPNQSLGGKYVLEYNSQDSTAIGSLCDTVIRALYLYLIDTGSSLYRAMNFTRCIWTTHCL